LHEVLKDVKVTEEKDVFDGLVTSLCCDWVFDIELPASAHKTLSYICGYQLKKTNVKIPHSVVKALNS